MMKNIAIITARGGSKRIPRKNIKLFFEKPIISYAIQGALESGLFSEVMVSTDDEEIAAISEKFGAEIPFLRSKEKANDFATTAEVLEEVLLEYKKRNIDFEHGCCIYPTAVFVTPDKLKNAYELLIEKKFDSVIPVVKSGNSFLRSLKLENGKLHLNFPEYENHRSQDLQTDYYDCGQFYWFRVDAFLKAKLLFTKNSGGFETHEMECQDIDTETDWRIAELKYRIRHGQA